MPITSTRVTALSVKSYANGEHYEGGFLADQQDGTGTHRWPSGASYEGQWVAGARVGL